MKNKTLFNVFDALLSQKEWLAENLSSPEGVKEYASNGMGINLTDEEAQKIFIYALAWTSPYLDLGGLSPSCFYWFEKPLSNEVGL